jgi:tryptophanyl-tRNA synthetase
MTIIDTRTAAQERSDDLARRIDDPSAPGRERLRVLTGDRPTGDLHVGHYLASLRNRVALQDKGIETYVLVADYQVITDRDSVGRIDEHVLSVVTDYLAAGIDPERSTIFAHSAIPELGQLMLPFLSLVTDAELRRNPTVKDELAATDGRPLSGLLLTYPVHQAADILFCHGTVVPVGSDQLPHVEQTRVIARRFNRRYALLTEVPMLLGLDGAKMSKSRGNTIPLRATADETAALIRGARTDSERRITFDPNARPEVANLLMIGARFADTTPSELADEIGEQGSAELKRRVTEAVNEALAEHRRRRRELEADPAYVLGVLRAGNERAREVAIRTLATVRSVMGMAY